MTMKHHIEIMLENYQDKIKIWKNGIEMSLETDNYYKVAKIKIEDYQQMIYDLTFLLQQLNLKEEK